MFLYEIVCIFIIIQSKYIISLLIEYFSSSNDQDFCLYVNSFILKVVVIVKGWHRGAGIITYHVILWVAQGRLVG